MCKKSYGEGRVKRVGKRFSAIKIVKYAHYFNLILTIMS